MIGSRLKILTRLLTPLAPSAPRNDQQAIDLCQQAACPESGQTWRCVGSFEHARYKSSAWFAKDADACLNMRLQDGSTICSIYFSD